jgi:hypothetical protein
MIGAAEKSEIQLNFNRISLVGKVNQAASSLEESSDDECLPFGLAGWVFRWTSCRRLMLTWV